MRAAALMPFARRARREICVRAGRVMGGRMRDFAPPRPASPLILPRLRGRGTTRSVVEGALQTLPYSAASSAGRMRRLWRACSSYSVCQSDGPLDGATCTAVTLYSGQLVAQSEKSVVMTLACVV